MSSAPLAKKLEVDLIEAAFDDAPWDDRPATEEEEIAMREVRDAEAAGTLVLIPGAVVTAETAERARRAKGE